jgi:ATP-dependent DNA helicase RecG
MALAINIEELINGRVIEWERLEFKKGWNPEDVIHSLCAFANDINNWGGGYIVVGIEENNGRPVLPPFGLNPDQIDKIQGELVGLCRRLQPNYLPIIQPYVFQEKHILVIYSPAGDMRPYSAPEGLGERGLKNRFQYIRSGSRSIKAQGEDLRKLQELTARIPFDDRINQQSSLDDLDLGHIRDFLHEVKSDLAEESAKMPFQDLCRQMNIAKGPDEALCPINAGIMFFCKEPHRFFERTWIEIVIRKDEAGKDFSEKYFKGPLHIQLRDALNYIRNNVIAEKVKKISGKAEANRFYNFPYDAIEESLANAVFHKSYEIGKPIEVQIWPDRIEILSFPGPVPPVNAKILAENKRIVARDYRNRRVGDFLKELHLTEGRSTGFPTIYKALEDNGSPPPIMETDEQCTYFLTVLHINRDFINEHDQESNKESNYVSNQESNQESNDVGNQESDHSIKVLKYCLMPRTRKSILKEIGISNQTKNYKKHIEPLVDKQLLQMTIPENPKNRNQKYKTTQKGKEKLNY